MFGRRASPAPSRPAAPVRDDKVVAAAPAAVTAEPDQRLQALKATIFADLIDAVDVAELARLDRGSVREEIGDIIAEIITMRQLTLSAAEQHSVVAEICDDVLGLGPLEPLLARDDIADIMVNGHDKVYIETDGQIQLTDIKFRDNAQLMNICQRIVSAVGRRVDESSPICDARLADGSRVNVIAPPLAIDGPTLTIRKFKRDKLTLEKLVGFGSINPAGARLLQIIGACRINTIVSGGTGSGKTTLLNCLTRYIDEGERIVTCEDAAELQLQQPHVVRLETRPPNLEGVGQITMRDLVKNCLRMRPERIIVGEVRGPEAFDLLQAMNTGHDGSMGTIHANNPREAISRIENMIAMGGYNLPAKTVREHIAGAVQVIVQAARLRDGSRRITHITEVMGMEGEVVTLQDLMVFEITGEDAQGRILGRHRFTGLRPGFWERARYFGRERELAEALEDSHA
ncbi:Type II secretion system protein E [Magnetospirillum sp. LM-5]|uniref:CpaF family protein n=1 Tax=Magnetospirillum sp. LM-5 TaxID=2681466 RepID=UPI00138626B3|nr:CpaF family protein [Magnetospirillum sp. LM-5]CAA7623936.1 Type II secretion system protein E [Magnetospirillum sp. LM-5]